MLFRSALLNAITGAGATVAPYPHTTNEPALGPLEDDFGVIHLVADLPGLAADGSERKGAALGQLERAKVVLHCLDASDPEDPAERLARVRGGVAAYMPERARQVVVATKCDLAPAPPQADVASPTLRQVSLKSEPVAAALDQPRTWQTLFWMSLITAGLTAFYTFRAVFMTFTGPTRVPAGAHGHGEHGHESYESPPAMTLPLIVLAVPSALIGWLLFSTNWL